MPEGKPTSLGVLRALEKRVDKLEGQVQGTNGSGIVTELQLLRQAMESQNKLTNQRIDNLAQKVDGITNAFWWGLKIFGGGLLLAILGAAAKFMAGGG